MNGSIQLHPKLGVNPKLTFCPRCHGEANELILIGIRTKVVECPSCDAKIIGGLRVGEKCPKCGHKVGWGETSRVIGEVGEHDKLPATEPCDKCKAELAEHKAIVEAGGVYWKCKDCPATGVIKPTAGLAKKIREHAKIAAPAPVGFEFDKTNCPACNPQK